MARAARGCSLAAAGSGRPGGFATFPKTINGWLEVTTTGAITGSDGCAFFSAISRTKTGRLRLAQVEETANGCIDESRPLIAMRTAATTLS